MIGTFPYTERDNFVDIIPLFYQQDLLSIVSAVYRLDCCYVFISLQTGSEWSNWCSERDEKNTTVVRTEAGEAPQSTLPATAEVWRVEGHV